MHRVIERVAKVDKAEIVHVEEYRGPFDGRCDPELRAEGYSAHYQ